MLNRELLTAVAIILLLQFILTTTVIIMSIISNQLWLTIFSFPILLTTIFGIGLKKT